MTEHRSGLLDWLSDRLNLTEIVSFLSSFGLIYTKLDIRKKLPEAFAEALDRPAQSYGLGARVLGLVAVILLALEILTGGLLAFYYLPTPESAHASVATIMRDVHFGGLTHQIHFWGAQLLILVLVFRLIRFLWRGVYKVPQELVWFFAAALLLVCLHADLTGRFLVWSSASYWSGMRAIEITQAVPGYGFLVQFLLGLQDSVIGDRTLIRYYLLHAAVLPGLAILLIYLHFSTIRTVGLLEKKTEPQQRPRNWFRLHLIHLAMVLTLVFGIVVTLAVVFPTSLGPEADPYHTATGVGPPWHFLAPFGFLELTGSWLPAWIAGSVVALAYLAFLVLPVFDRATWRGGSRKIFLGVMALLAVAWILLTFYGRGVA